MRIYPYESRVKTAKYPLTMLDDNEASAAIGHHAGNVHYYTLRIVTQLMTSM